MAKLAERNVSKVPCARLSGIPPSPQRNLRAIPKSTNSSLPRFAFLGHAHRGVEELTMLRLVSGVMSLILMGLIYYRQCNLTR
jgi:hypothetical protein